MDEKKVTRIMGGVTAPFTKGTDRHYVSPTALRMGIDQLVYDQLQQVVIRRCRQIFHLQPHILNCLHYVGVDIMATSLASSQPSTDVAAYLFHHYGSARISYSHT